MSELPLKATLKAGSDYSAPWLTVDAHDPDDLTTKLTAIANGGAPQALVEAANALKAANNAAPLLSGGGAPAPQQPAAPPQQSGWGQPAPQQQQQAPAQQQRPREAGWQAPATFHPEGKTCDACGKGLQYKKTSSGKGTWRCEDWRWNNGSPNEHTQLWA